MWNAALSLQVEGYRLQPLRGATHCVLQPRIIRRSGHYEGVACRARRIGNGGCCEQAVRQQAEVEAAVGRCGRRLEVELCAQHARAGAVDAMGMTFRNRGWSKHPSYGLVGSKKGGFCSQYVRVRIEDLARKPSGKQGFSTQPSYIA